MNLFVKSLHICIDILTKKSFSISYYCAEFSQRELLFHRQIKRTFPHFKLFVDTDRHNAFTLHENTRLSSIPFASLQARSVLHCALACYRIRECTSMQVEKEITSQTRKTCQLVEGPRTEMIPSEEVNLYLMTDME